MSTVRSQGENVSLVSYPGFAPGAETSVMTATVTERRIISGRSCYILSEQVAPGQSGGPILDAKGCVVGVIQHGKTTNSKGEREGMDSGIGLRELLRFIAAAKDSPGWIGRDRVCGDSARCSIES